MVDTNLKQILLKEDIRSYQDAQQEGVVGYYVTAELVPEVINTWEIFDLLNTHGGYFFRKLVQSLSWEMGKPIAGFTMLH